MWVSSRGAGRKPIANWQDSRLYTSTAQPDAVAGEAGAVKQQAPTWRGRSRRQVAVAAEQIAKTPPQTAGFLVSLANSPSATDASRSTQGMLSAIPSLQSLQLATEADNTVSKSHNTSDGCVFALDVEPCDPSPSSDLLLPSIGLVRTTTSSRSRMIEAAAKAAAAPLTPASEDESAEPTKADAQPQPTAEGSDPTPAVDSVNTDGAERAGSSLGGAANKGRAETDVHRGDSADGFPLRVVEAHVVDAVTAEEDAEYFTTEPVKCTGLRRSSTACQGAVGDSVTSMICPDGSHSKGTSPAVLRHRSMDSPASAASSSGAGARAESADKPAAAARKPLPTVVSQQQMTCGTPPVAAAQSSRSTDRAAVRNTPLPGSASAAAPAEPAVALCPFQSQVKGATVEMPNATQAAPAAADWGAAQVIMAIGDVENAAVKAVASTEAVASLTASAKDRDMQETAWRYRFTNRCGIRHINLREKSRQKSRENRCDQQALASCYFWLRCLTAACWALCRDRMSLQAAASGCDAR